jgi:orotate phosphoribosyltransferase
LKVVDSPLAEFSRLLSHELWRLGAVRINVDEPFRLVSGRLSPFYINCRQVISSVAFVDLFLAASSAVFKHRHIDCDGFAGGESAGIPFAAFLARANAKPMLYVRKAAKEHGIASRIEGSMPVPASVILVEDLITDAGSKLSFLDALAQAGYRVSDVLVLFDRLQGGEASLAARNIQLHALTNITITMEVASQYGFATPADIRVVNEFLQNPDSWQKS